MEDEENSSLGAKLLPVILGAALQFGVNAYQNWQNRRNWREQNEYNAPASQMQRYYQAGLSPNLIYGSGSAASAGNAGSIAPYQSQNVSAMDAANFLTALLNIRSIRKGLLKTDSEIASVDAATEGQRLANQRSALENHYLEANLSQRNALQALQMRYLTGQIGLQDYQKGVLSAQAERLTQDALNLRYNRETYLPSILGIRRQEIWNTIRRTDEEFKNWSVERENWRKQGTVLDKDILWYPWIHGSAIGRNVLGGLGSIIGSFGIGKAAKAARAGFSGGGMSGSRSQLGTEWYP